MYNIQDYYCTKYKIIIVQDRRLSLYKIEDDYCTKYKIIIIQNTRKLLYEMQENYCTRYYKIIIVQYIRLLLYKIQEFYCIRYKYCTRYNIITVHDTCCMIKLHKMAASTLQHIRRTRWCWPSVMIDGYFVYTCTVL